jgi:hypothetical protein
MLTSKQKSPLGAPEREVKVLKFRDFIKRIGGWKEAWKFVKSFWAFLGFSGAVGFVTAFGFGLLAYLIVLGGVWGWKALPAVGDGIKYLIGLAFGAG